MRLFTFVVIVSVLVAGVASAKPPLQRGSISWMQKTLASAVFAGTLWGVPLAADYNPATIATQTRGSDTALQEQIKQEKGSDIALQEQIKQEKGSDTALKVDFSWEEWNVRLSQIDLDFKELWLELRSMRAYDPDFAYIAAAFREQERNWQTTFKELIQVLREEGYVNKAGYFIEQIEKEKKVKEMIAAQYSTASRLEQISYWIEGARGVVRENISWTAKHGTVGIDYRDVKHYRTVKDTLTAQDYDGVSVHYFVDGKSYRGVADAIHPELPTKVRVGKKLINVAQISGVRISMYSQPRRWSNYKTKPLQVVAEPHIAEPVDLLELIDPRFDRDHNRRHYDTIRGRLALEGVRIYWRGFQRTENPHDYTDGYGEFLVDEVVLYPTEEMNWYKGKDTLHIKNDTVILVNYGDLPAPTVRASSIAWNLHESDIFTSAYGDERQVYGIANDLQLRFYERVKGLLTAADYREGLVRYRQGDTNHTAQVLGARDAEQYDTLGAVVVDLVTGKEKHIVVADIQGMLLLKQADYGRAVTIKIGDTDYYGELFLAFSNGELTALIHATRRQGEGVELLDDMYTITVHREDERLIMH